MRCAAGRRESLPRSGGGLRRTAGLSLRALDSQQGVTALRSGWDLRLKILPSRASRGLAGATEWQSWGVKCLRGPALLPAVLCGAGSPGAQPNPALYRQRLGAVQESQASFGRKVSHSIHVKMDPSYLMCFKIKKGNEIRHQVHL